MDAPKHKNTVPTIKKPTANKVVFSGGFLFNSGALGLGFSSNSKLIRDEFGDLRSVMEMRVKIPL